jgi:transposase
MRPQVSAQLVREFTYAFAAVSPHDGVLDSLVLPEVNAETMSLFLAEVASRHPDDFILMFLDQAGWHKARALVVPANMRLVLPEVNAQTMSLFLAEVASRHPDDFILMFLDQAGWHKARALVVPANMRLEWLPPYSPECNPVEHLWDEIREKWFANRLFRHLDAVEDTLVVALHALEGETERIRSITGFDWVISIHLNAT